MSANDFACEGQEELNSRLFQLCVNESRHHDVPRINGTEATLEHKPHECFLILSPILPLIPPLILSLILPLTLYPDSSSSSFLILRLMLALSVLQFF